MWLSSLQIFQPSSPGYLPYSVETMDGGAVSAGPCSRPQAQQDLNITAEALYNRMGDASFASDDIYWASLPTHLRQFIRNALPLAGNLPQSGSQPGILPGGVQSAGGQVAMYKMAQEIIGAATRTFDDKRSAKEFGMFTETGVIESTRRDDLSQRGGKLHRLSCESRRCVCLDHVNPLDKPSGRQNISTRQVHLTSVRQLRLISYLFAFLHQVLPPISPLSISMRLQNKSHSGPIQSLLHPGLVK
jgi:hypothetical protein